MKMVDIIQLENILKHCASYESCDSCSLDWMEDHGDCCYRFVAEQTLEYIEMLKHKINEYAKLLDNVEVVPDEKA